MVTPDTTSPPNLAKSEESQQQQQQQHTITPVDTEQLMAPTPEVPNLQPSSCNFWQPNNTCYQKYLHMKDLAQLHLHLNNWVQLTINRRRQRKISTSGDTMAHLGEGAIHLDRDHLGKTITFEAAHHHLGKTTATEAAHHHRNGLETHIETSRGERTIGDHL